MSNDNTLPAFEILLADKKVNSLLEALIEDHAFSTGFLASCVANYYVTVLQRHGYVDISSKTGKGTK